VEVEIWSDVACPWCYIGKRRFEAALAEFEHRDDVHVRWRSFELDPEAPSERVGDRADYLAQKYGMSLEQARAAEQQLTDVAAGEGLEFRFDIARSGNTFDAHRIVHLAEDHARAPGDRGGARRTGGSRRAGGGSLRAGRSRRRAHRRRARHQCGADVRGRPPARNLGRPAA
jgi:hypothetical protein